MTIRGLIEAESDSQAVGFVARYDGPAGVCTATSGPNRNGSYEDHVMAIKALPSQEVLRQLLDYDAETGILTWRVRTPDHFTCAERDPSWACNRWNAQWAGTVALASVKSEGYLGGRLLGRPAKSHRVIWKWMTGQDPDFVDHINHIKSDNRFSNLRSVSFYENVRNAKLRHDNKTGKPGVRLDKKDGKFYATGKDGIRTLHLGRFDTLDDAVTARCAWEQEKGFHANHGMRAEGAA